MNISQLARVRPLYSLWRSLRRRKQRSEFSRLLDCYLADSTNRTAYHEGLASIRLRDKAGRRRPFIGIDRKPGIVAFGSQVWEQYGLWPAFEHLSRFHLSIYGTELADGPIETRVNSLRRSQLARGFLRFVDQIEQEQPVTCAFFYASGAHIASELLDDLAQRGIWSIVMSLDDKHQFLQPLDQDGLSHQLRVATRCDLYWTTWKTGTQIVFNQGGTPWYAAEGADPNYFRPLEVPRDLDVVFIGEAYGPRADLVHFLRRRGFTVEAFGNGWPSGRVTFQQMIELYSRAHVVLGVAGVGHMMEVKHLKGRDFEVPMCGAVHLTSYNPELADWFEIGKEVLCYSSFEECADTLHWVLRHPLEAEQIRHVARRRSVSAHTWEHRLKSLFDLFGP